MYTFIQNVITIKDMWNVHASLNEEISEEEMRKLSLGYGAKKT